jgi:hypothetical protein
VSPGIADGGSSLTGTFAQQVSASAVDEISRAAAMPMTVALRVNLADTLHLSLLA